MSEWPSIDAIKRERRRLSRRRRRGRVLAALLGTIAAVLKGAWRGRSA